MRKLIFLIGSYFIFTQLTFGQSGQIPVGTWRTHFSYYNTTNLANSSRFIYAGSQESFFRFDIAEMEIQKLTKDEGFSGLGMNVMNYDKNEDFLLIGYGDGQLDYIEGDKKVGNIPDIINSSSILGSKSINGIHFYKGFAYLSCDFGVVKFDIQNKEIPEDYRNLGGDTVGNNPAFSTSIYGTKDSIFVATQKGLMVAPFRPEVNLQDGTNWKFFLDPGGNIIDGISLLEIFNDKLYAAQKGDTSYTLLTYDGQWDTLKIYPQVDIKEIRANEFQIGVVVGSSVEIWDMNGIKRKIEDSQIPDPQSYVMDKKGKDWVGSLQIGLMSNIEGGFKNYSPPGPFSNLAQQAQYVEDQMVITGGSYNPDNGKEGSRFTGFFEFKKGDWTNYNPKDVPNTEKIPVFIRDVVSSTFNNQTGFTYYCSNGNGLLSRSIDDTWKLYDETNSPLRNQDPTNNYRAVRVLDAEVDAEGNLWVTNPLVGNNLHQFHPDIGWQSFVLDGAEPAEIVIDNVGNKWIRGLPNRGGGIIVFNENESQLQKKLSATVGSGDLPSIRVNAVTKDLSGDIWVGTDDGVAVFFSPESIFSSSPSDAVTPIFEQRPLLRFEKVTAIAVDGGNRKWIGTINGIWLFNPDGSEVIENFRENNSPIPSDKITSIGIHPKTGEVFFVTEKGLVSYRGTATDGKEVHESVTIFPNPVPPDYNGIINISGLVENAIVKITDINGRLFYELKASGGTAAWDGRDYKGNKPTTGVYMIFSTDSNGQESYVAKIAFIQ
jgi:TSS9, PorZ, N-terminal beta-propeller domain